MEDVGGGESTAFLRPFVGVLRGEVLHRHRFLIFLFDRVHFTSKPERQRVRLQNEPWGPEHVWIHGSPFGPGRPSR